MDNDPGLICVSYSCAVDFVMIFFVHSLVVVVVVYFFFWGGWQAYPYLYLSVCTIIPNCYIYE